MAAWCTNIKANLFQCFLITPRKKKNISLLISSQLIARVQLLMDENDKYLFTQIDMT
jgi:hypothetical protein